MIDLLNVTLSMIGHSQESFIINVKGLPVTSAVCVQSLIANKLQLPRTPFIYYRLFRVFCIYTSAVSNNQEFLLEENYFNSW